MISTKGRYALRVMADLAENGGEDRFIPIREIAERQQIPAKYLETILRKLVSGGMLEGHRGPNGGYRLLKPSSEYTLGEILVVTERALAPVACLQPGAEPCSRSGSCRTLPMWKKLDRLTRDFYNGITVRDLISDMAERGAEEL